MTITVPVGTIDYHYPTSGVIVVTAAIQHAFQEAHFALLGKRGVPPSPNHMSIMKKWWLEEYNITIIDRWFAMEFTSDHELTAFLLRWA